MEVSPLDKKTISVDVLKVFAEKVKTGKGSLILRGCSNFDENDRSAIIGKRLENVKDELIKLGVSKENIILEYASNKVDLTAKPKSMIDTTNTEDKKELLKAHNRFVEIKFLKRSN